MSTGLLSVTVNILEQTAEITDSEMSQTTVCTVNILKQTAEITDSEMSQLLSVL